VVLIRYLPISLILLFSKSPAVSHSNAAADSIIHETAQKVNIILILFYLSVPDAEKSRAFSLYLAETQTYPARITVESAEIRMRD
ncbi:MAG: hypothetical protein K5705_05965, partial [Oscillospiraceae bacterium]|nr:hypothetical protein [Oscillospiraceae bacterium]